MLTIGYARVNKVTHHAPVRLAESSAESFARGDDTFKPKLFGGPDQLLLLLGQVMIVKASVLPLGNSTICLPSFSLTLGLHGRPGGSRATHLHSLLPYPVP